MVSKALVKSSEMIVTCWFSSSTCRLLVCCKIKTMAGVEPVWNSGAIEFPPTGRC